MDDASGAAADALQACIAECLRCHGICLRSAMVTCLEMGGDHLEPRHFRLLLNCAEICRTAASVMIAAAPLHGAVCGACADICEACARSCERLGSLQDCVDACRSCAALCRSVAD